MEEHSIVLEPVICSRKVIQVLLGVGWHTTLVIVHPHCIVVTTEVPTIVLDEFDRWEDVLRFLEMLDVDSW